MDATDALDGLTSPVTVERFGAGSYDARGNWVAPLPSTLTIQAVVQPLRPHELAILPEGMRERGAVRVHTVTELATADETAKRLPDVVLWQGARYPVHAVNEFKVGVLDHYEALAVREV